MNTQTEYQVDMMTAKLKADNDRREAEPNLTAEQIKRETRRQQWRLFSNVARAFILWAFVVIVFGLLMGARW
jgi:ABC-type transport system involved in cytochrome c biogenesis permease subunit